MARSDPLATKPWPMTSPSPRAPPVTTLTRPASEKDASVGRSDVEVSDEDGSSDGGGYVT